MQAITLAKNATFQVGEACLREELGKDFQAFILKINDFLSEANSLANEANPFFITLLQSKCDEVQTWMQEMINLDGNREFLSELVNKNIMLQKVILKMTVNYEMATLKQQLVERDSQLQQAHATLLQLSTYIVSSSVLSPSAEGHISN